MSLRDQLMQRIRASGPISIAEYMAECLMHPEFGYYATRDPFGTAGDFITSPEISQMFGELIGLALAQAWTDQGAPKNAILVELGPGRGTLMQDALRATAQIPAFAPDVWLIEASPALRQIQARTLSEHADRINWAHSFEELPQNAPVFVIANEFFDALPIQQFVRDGTGWCEICVGIDADALTFGRTPRQSLPALDHRLADTRDGDIVEHCSALPGWISSIGQQIANNEGAALIIDYGDWRSQGDTLQAMSDHKPTPVLDSPGEADLTAHVDFEAIAQAAPPAKFTRVTPQGMFLERLGITQRAQQLAQGMADTQLAAHIDAHRRLTHPEEMGNLFKVIGLFPDGAAPPPGLDT